MAFETFFCVTLLVVFGSAQSFNESCSKNGDIVASPSDCKQYFVCSEGMYEVKSCGFWQKFDGKTNSCRLSPLAACRSEPETVSLLAENRLYCNYTSDICTHGVPVINNCDWYCFCCQNGSYTEPIQCRPGTYYDVKMFACTDDKTACSDIPTAPTPGSICLNPRDTVGFESDCRKYYQCDVTKTWIIQECAWGQYYDQDSGQCKINWIYYHCH